MIERRTDALVIGSGIAGLTFALKVAASGSVLVVTKKERANSNTNWARGGIAAVFGPDDDLALHVEDTLVAGAGLSHLEAVEALVSEGPARVEELMAWGAAFHRGEHGRLLLGKEGGHSRRRIVHAGDRTGFAIESALLEAVAREPRITVLEDHLAVDLLLGPDPTSGRRRCRGALTLDHRNGERVKVLARATFLASGGSGQVYRHTTNPSIATGDGVAMAFRAGACVANMEFVQFHPTALFPTEDPAFLISEALRGEGGTLRRLDGTSFMEAYHPMKSLAPRDVVARAIHRELRERGEDHAVLDVSEIPRADFEQRFPDTTAGLRARGIDPYADGIPVVPAAHYVCGGVVTDVRGRTDLPGLWAAGEVACTGVHGANRLASNSLLEAVVFSHRAAEAVAAIVSAPAAGSTEVWLPGGLDPDAPSTALPPAPTGPAGGERPARSPAETRRSEDVQPHPNAPATTATGSLEPAARASVAGPGGERGDALSEPTHDGMSDVEIRHEVRDLMWRSAGIIRTSEDLENAADRLATLAARRERRWRVAPWTPEGLELRNMILASELIVACGRARKESRGLHRLLGYDGRDNEHLLRDTRMRRTDDTR